MTASLTSIVLGLTSVILFLIKPWRTCSYDDAPAACTALDRDVALLSLGTAVLVLGIAASITLAVKGRSKRTDDALPTTGRRPESAS